MRSSVVPVGCSCSTPLKLKQFWRGAVRPSGHPVWDALNASNCSGSQPPVRCRPCRYVLCLLGAAWLVAWVWLVGCIASPTAVHAGGRWHSCALAPIGWRRRGDGFSGWTGSSGCVSIVWRQQRQLTADQSKMHMQFDPALAAHPGGGGGGGGIIRGEKGGGR